MIELVNVVMATVASFILGLTVHSVHLHSKKRREIKPMPWNHEEAEINE